MLGVVNGVFSLLNLALQMALCLGPIAWWIERCDRPYRPDQQRRVFSRTVRMRNIAIGICILAYSTLTTAILTLDAEEVCRRSANLLNMIGLSADISRCDPDFAADTVD